MSEARAVIVSDIHLGPGGPLTVFQDGQALAALLDRLATDKQDTELVLGGDVFDFLQCPGYRGFDHSKAVARFDAIVRHNRSVFEALGRFAQLPQHEVTLLSGNHDPEVMLPVVRDAFEQAIGRPGGVRYEERLVSGSTENWSVWGRALFGDTVWVVHGDRWDIQNAIDRDALVRDQHVVLPPGSRLVYEVFSELQPIKPWVYDLKPEVETVVPLLLYLDPVRTLRYLRENYGLTWKLLKGKILARIAVGPVLASGQAAKTQSNVADIIADSLKEGLLGQPEVLLAQFETWQTGLTSGTDTLASHRGVTRWLLRAWLSRVRKSQRFLAEDGDDDLPGHAASYWPDTLRTFIAGHTHGPRRKTGASPTYFNSGTWIPVGRLPEGDIEQVIDDMEAGKPWPITVPRTFVLVEKGGAQVRLGRCDAAGVPQGGVH